MRLIVEIVSGSDRGKALPLNPGEVRRVGRSEEADLRITEDPLVSRLHFSVEWTGTECRVRDLGSRNGTAVNGITVTEVALSDGGEVTAGNTHLRVRIVDDEVPARRPIFRDARNEAEAPEGTGVPAKTVPSQTERSRGVIQPEAKDSDAALDLVPRSVRRPYRDALGDVDPEVRRSALYAAAWARQKWLIDYCLAQAKNPRPDDWEPLYLLAVLGRSEHFADILALAKRKKLGPRRFALIGTFGDSRGVRVLLEAMSGDDPLEATVAAAAFEKITAIEIPRSAEEKPRPGNDSRGTDIAVAPGALPDPAAARSIWKDQEKNFASPARWCRGYNVTNGANDDVLAQLDMESRFEASLRARFEGRRSEGVVALHAFPQGRKTIASV